MASMQGHWGRRGGLSVLEGGAWQGAGVAWQGVEARVTQLEGEAMMAAANHCSGAASSSSKGAAAAGGGEANTSGRGSRGGEKESMTCGPGWRKREGIRDES